MHSETERDVYGILEEVHAIARAGLVYAENPWDRERYARLAELSAMAHGLALDLPAADVRRALSVDVGHVTPKIGAEAAVFDDDGRALLVQMPDGTWALPGGFVDPGESPADAAVRETREETGIEVALGPLVDVFFRPASARSATYSLVAVLYLCTAVEGALRCSHEHVDVAYRFIDDVERWRGAHEERVRVAHARWTASRS